MINAPQLLADLKRRLALLESDLRERIDTLPDLKASLHAEWQAARDASRTAETLESWSYQVITQAGVHWLLTDLTQQPEISEAGQKRCGWH